MRLFWKKKYCEDHAHNSFERTLEFLEITIS
jgi:hypothetical protein